MHHIDIASLILHRDADMLVIDKPARIAVHAASGKDSGIDRLFGELRFGEPRDPALAHRLDKDTSGCLVLGRRREALARLGKLFREGRIAKTYWAVVAGAPAAESGIIDQPLARKSHDRRTWVMKIASPGDPSAERAITDFRVLARGDGLSLLELSPRTGRTHQLRVHCDAMGCPIAGDPIYGGDRAKALARHLHLHARRVVVPFDPARPVDVSAPLPAHMRALVRLTGMADDASTTPEKPRDLVR